VGLFSRSLFYVVLLDLLVSVDMCGCLGRYKRDLQKRPYKRDKRSTKETVRCDWSLLTCVDVQGSFESHRR